MNNNIGKNTLRIIEKEKKRYQEIKKNLDKRNTRNFINGNIKNLIILDNFKNESEIDLEKSTFVLKKYKIYEVFAYDYTVEFSSPKNNYYRAIVITEVNLDPFYYNFYRIGKQKHDREKYSNCLITKDDLTTGIIKQTFSDCEDKNPYILYTSSNIGASSIWKENAPCENKVAYYSKDNEMICEFLLKYPEKCTIISEKNEIPNYIIEEWIKNNISTSDDPTKIVEIMGCYNTSEKLKKLAKSLYFYL